MQRVPQGRRAARMRRRIQCITSGFAAFHKVVEGSHATLRAPTARRRRAASRTAATSATASAASSAVASIAFTSSSIAFDRATLFLLPSPSNLR